MVWIHKHIYSWPVFLLNDYTKGTCLVYRDVSKLRKHPYTACDSCLARNNCVETTVFMQDGVPPHIGRQVQRLLRETFTDERIISRSFPNPWPARSPDLNPFYFWLRGYLKDRVHQGHVRSLVDLKTSIQRHVAQIARVLLRATIN